MKSDLIWVLIHIVGPITLITVIGGLAGKVLRAINPDLFGRFTGAIGAAAGKVWHMLFLSSEEKSRYQHYLQTGVDPMQPETAETTDTDAETTDPDSDEDTTSPAATEQSADVPDVLKRLFAEATSETPL